MKNHKGRNLVCGLLLLGFSTLLGCDELPAADGSVLSEIQNTTVYESIEQEMESSLSSMTESVVSTAAAVESSVSSRLAESSSRTSSNTARTSSAVSPAAPQPESTEPAPAPLTTPKKRMATNGLGVFACLDDSGKAYVWGMNYNLNNVPVDLPPLVDIALGQDFAVGLDANGKLYTWGELGQNDFGQTRFGENLPPFVEVEASAYHTAALTADGTLYKWGNTNSGDQKSVPQNLGKVKSVAVDAYVSAVITAEDKVVRWGVGPRNVFSSTYSMVSCSHYDVFALGKDGRVYGTFTLLDGHMQAVQPPEARNIVKISGTLALDSNGKVFGWGANQLYKHDEMADVPVNLPKIIDITGSGMNGMAYGENGKIYTWGYGVETFSHTAFDFLSSEPNVYADEPAYENKESISVKTLTELQTAISNPVCKSITIEGNISIAAQSYGIQKDLTVAAGSTLTIESTAANTMINGKLTVNGTIVVKGRLWVSNDANVTVTGSILRQNGGAVTTYFRDFAHLENLLKSDLYSEIIYTPGSPTVFTIERDLTIPAGKSVWVNINVTVKVAAGATLTVSGQFQTYNQPIVEGKVVGTVTVFPKG